MGAIIVKDGEASRKRMLDMFPPASMEQLVKAITRTIGKSYETHGMRNPTNAETRRRFNMIMKYVVDLRGERKWGVQRICDSLGDILRAELNGERYRPDDDRTVWVRKDGD